MSQLQWAEELYVGLGVIDDQHRELFGIAHDLLEAIAENRGQAVLGEIFERLKEYTEYHFKEEEALMEKVGYPDRTAHAAQHALLIIRVESLKRMIENGESISAEGVSQFLKNWIYQHIMQEDAAIRKFMPEQD